jgi:hypothetical protein
VPEHLELSLASVESYVAALPLLRVVKPNPLESWLDAVHQAEEACLILDREGLLAGISEPCLDLLGFDNPDYPLGRGLLDIVTFVRFTADGAALRPHDAIRLPPIAALQTETMSRGLVRISVDGGRGTALITADVVATPLCADGSVVGSLSFFAQV